MGSYFIPKYMLILLIYVKYYLFSLPLANHKLQMANDCYKGGMGHLSILTWIKFQYNQNTFIGL